MLELYWTCLLIGVVFTLITVLLGDVIDHTVDGVLDFLHLDGVHVLRPLVIIGGLAGLGGAGIVFTKFLMLTEIIILGLSILLGIILAMSMYFVFVKPMQHAESTTGFSVTELSGHIGEVITTIPATGCGEVLVKVGAGHTNQIAESVTHKEIVAGTRIVVIDVAQDGTLYVSPFEEE
jgi:membrane-bound ClpP family serine protease